MQDEHTDPVTEMVFRGLVEHDAHNEVAPALATDWTVSQDGLVYEFTLRDGVTWQDGEPFTAADVVFTLDAVHAPDSEAATAKNFHDIASVEAPDDATVVITLVQQSRASVHLAAVAAVALIALTVGRQREGGGDPFGALDALRFRHLPDHRAHDRPQPGKVFSRDACNA